MAVNVSNERLRRFRHSGRTTIAFPPEATSYEYATGVAVDAQGRIVVSGSTNNLTVLLRLTDGGSLDPAFGDDGRTIVEAGSPNALIVDRRGRFVVAGQINIDEGGAGIDVDMSVARFRADGSVDDTFATGGIATIRFDRGGGDTDRAFSIVELPDGRLVVLGFCDVGGGLTTPAAVRLLDDGAVDPSFGAAGEAVFDFAIATGAFQWFVGSVVSGGKVVVAATFMERDNVDWSVDDFLVRLENDAMLGDGLDPLSAGPR